jgi:pre-rRNA-processing protein IPI3
MGDACVLSTDSTGTSLLWNLASRCLVATFKENGSVTRGSALVSGSREDGRSHADGILSCQTGRAFVHMFSMANVSFFLSPGRVGAEWEASHPMLKPNLLKSPRPLQDQPLFKCGMSEPMHSIATDGTYVVCGGASGRVYLWVLGSGVLLRVWNAHYKRVGSVVFSPCSTLIITGGDDGIISCWPVAALIDVLDEADLSAQPSPCTTWTDHSLPITSLRFGPGIGLSAILVSTSLDRTARIWDVSGGRCIASIECPSAVHTSCIDPLLRRLYLSCIVDTSAIDGATSACVCEVDLLAAAARTADPTAMVLGPTSGADGLGATGFDYPCFIGHTGIVNEMAVSPDGATLVTAGQDGSVRLWDTTSRGCVQVFDGHKTSPVVSLLLVPRYNRSVGVSGVNTGVGAAPHTPMAPLKKHQVPMAVEWKGSSTGPLDALVIVPRTPLEFRGALSFGTETSTLSSLYSRDAAMLLAALDTAAGAAGSSGVAVTEPETAVASAAAHPSVSSGDELVELRRRNAQLEDENRRWQVVNNALLAKITATSGPSAEEGADDAQHGQNAGSKRLRMEEARDSEHLTSSARVSGQ